MFTIKRAKFKLYKIATATVQTERTMVMLVCVHRERKDFPFKVPIDEAIVAPEHSG